MAGYYGLTSYTSSYPEPHRLFLEKGHLISETGVIGDEIEGILGSVIDCSQAQLIEIIDVLEETDEYVPPWWRILS